MRQTPHPTGRHPRPRILFVPLLLVGALALAGCSAAGSSSSAGGSEGTRSEGGSQSVQSTGTTARDAATPAKSARDQVVTGALRMRADSAIDTARAASGIVTDAGGRIDARSETPRSGSTPASAILTLRIPAAKLDSVLDKLSALGDHVAVSTNAADVTDTREDTAARITALQRTIAAYEGFLATAKSTQDLISLESAISDRQAELETLQAQQRGLDDSVALATITLEVREVAPVVSTVPGDFGSGVAVGWAAFVTFVTGLLVVLGVATPWIVLAGLVLAAVFVIRRLVRRRRPTGPVPPPASAA